MYSHTAFEVPLHEQSVTKYCSRERSVTRLCFVVTNMLYTCIINNKIEKNEYLFWAVQFFALDYHKCLILFQFPIFLKSECKLKIC